MKLELTASNGKAYTFEGFGKNGDEVKIKLVNEYNQKKAYVLRITASGRLVMN